MLRLADQPTVPKTYLNICFFFLTAFTCNSIHESTLGFVTPSDSCDLFLQIYMFLMFKDLEVLPCIGIFAVEWSK